VLSNVPLFTSPCSSGTLSIHALRILLTLPSLPLPNANPSFGLRLPTTASSTTSISPPTLFYTLSTELKPHKTLLITFFSSPSIPWSAVLAAAAREGCGRIEIWGDRFGKDWPVEKGERARRGESAVPMLLPLNLHGRKLI
jgi:hypothetical protein